jgi:hypothetical protein
MAVVIKYMSNNAPPFRPENVIMFALTFILLMWNIC